MRKSRVHGIAGLAVLAAAAVAVAQTTVNPLPEAQPAASAPIDAAAAPADAVAELAKTHPHVSVVKIDDASATSPCACASGLPISAPMTRASSSARSS